MQGVVIAGTHSGCGKTTITLGILAALQKRGYTVQPFKAGPDFIDTGLHKLVTGRISRNLDLWMCSSEYVRECFQRHASDADIAVIEGVMGMYDGNHSTADLAAVLDLPVILVVDAYGMAESAGAVVRGFTEYHKESRDREIENVKKARVPATRPKIAGVILNRVASERHYRRLKESIQGVPVLGFLPRELSFKIPHRHLGLLVAEENPINPKELDRLADTMLAHVNFDAIGSKNEKKKQRKQNFLKEKKVSTLTGLPTSPPKIAVAYDRAFCFYYEDNLDVLKNEGAEVIQFSPLSDTMLPTDIDVLYIGGGYPELYAEKLSANRSMLEAVKKFALLGRPVYAECGGFMYLTEGIYDSDNVFHPMAGVFPFKTRMTEGRVRLGYREVQLKENSLLGQVDCSIRGHEFHYSEVMSGEGDRHACVKGITPEVRTVYTVKDGEGKYLYDEGYQTHNTLGSYLHLHFASNRSTGKKFINFVKEQYGTYTSGRTR